jgi:peptide/nickel transport system permease protein
VIRQDYVTTARAKGQTEGKIVKNHMLRNALIPVITTMGTTLGYQLGGALVAETVFSIPGLGSYLTSSINGLDYPAVQGVVLFIAILFCLVMLGVDLLYAFVDPRIKAQYAKHERKKRGG